MGISAEDSIYAYFDEETNSVVINGIVAAYTGKDSELAATVKAMLGDDRYDELVPIYLAIAKQAILLRRYPMDNSKTWDDTKGAYNMIACQIAVQLINKRGAEGETQHEENQVRRVYRGTDIPKDMLVGIVPCAGVPR